MRRPLAFNAQRTQISRVMPLPPPVGGWDAVSSLANMPADRAIVLDNWFPTPTDVRVRRGHALHSSGMGTGPVETLMVYNPLTGADKMFGVTGGTIYDVSIAGTATATTVTGLTSNRMQYVNFTVAGGHYLMACNGVDTIKAYNGSAWSAPGITGANTDIVHLNVHKNRLWMVQKDTMSAWYLATLSIAGAAVEFPLGGNFSKGGYLMAMATWTFDGGSGTDDLAAFITSEGQVAIYQGTDPSSTDTWSLVGVFNVGKPIGRRCFTKVGADVALINQDGVLPLSKAIRQDRGAASVIALTNRINNAMNTAAQSYKDNFGWELTPYPLGTMALLNVPVAESSEQHQYVMNTITGAWCRFKGMNANCWAVFDDNLYFGGNTGLVLKADTGANDLASTIDAVGQCAYNYYGYHGLKQWPYIQLLLTTSSGSNLAIGMSTDFQDNANLGTPTSASVGASVFDTALWDTAVFSTDFLSSTNWTMPTALGMCSSIHFRAITGNENLGEWGTGLWGSALWGEALTNDVVIRVNGFHSMYQPGGLL